MRTMRLSHIRDNERMCYMNDTPGISPALRRIVLIAILLTGCVCAAIGYAVAHALAPLLARYASLVGALLLALSALASLGGLRILFAYGRQRAAIARQAEIVTMQNQQPVHLDDVTIYAARLLPHTIERYYD